MSDEPYVWSDLCERAIRLFGDAPMGEMEYAIIEHWKRAPAKVEKQIEQIGEGVAAGRIRKPWAVLRKALDDGPSDVAPVTDSARREKAIERAKVWTRNAGGILPSEGELLDELFGAGGMLHAYAADESLRAEMLDHWREAFAANEQVEAEQVERLQPRQRVPADPEALAQMAALRAAVAAEPRPGTRPSPPTGERFPNGPPDERYFEPTPEPQPEPVAVAPADDEIPWSAA